MYTVYKVYFDEYICESVVSRHHDSFKDMHVNESRPMRLYYGNLMEQ